MLEWITGSSWPADDQQHKEDAVTKEPPDTPAPLFAVRAFKHAIFGTPKPSDESSQDHGSGVINVRDKQVQGREGMQRLQSQGVLKPATEPGSPPRPPGILMTPGTATTRRKTVSFGSQVLDNEGKTSSRTGLPNDYPGKFPSPWTPKTEDPSTEARRRTKLTETLYNTRENKSISRGDKPKKLCNGAEPQHSKAKGRNGLDSNSAHSSNPEKRLESCRDDEDVTIDFGAPRSRSGQYWKQEYEEHADRTKREMEKIIKKQRLAKKYAIQKDAENQGLTNQLYQAKQKKDKPAPSCLSGDQDQGEENSDLDEDIDLEGTRRISPRTVQALKQTKEELRRAREQLQELGSLRSKIEDLQKSLSEAAATAATLEGEKVSLQHELKRVKDEMERFPERRKRHEDRQKQREEKLEAEKQKYRDNYEQVLAEAAVLREQIRTSQQSGLHGPSSESDHHEQQQKQRKILQELRCAKEEVSRLRTETGLLKAQMQDARAKSRQSNQRSTSPAKKATSTGPVADIWAQAGGSSICREPARRPSKQRRATSPADGMTAAKSPAKKTTPSKSPTKGARSPLVPRSTNASREPSNEHKSRTPSRLGLAEQDRPSSPVLPSPEPDIQDHMLAESRTKGRGNDPFLQGPSYVIPPSSPPVSTRLRNRPSLRAAFDTLAAASEEGNADLAERPELSKADARTKGQGLEEVENVNNATAMKDDVGTRSMRTNSKETRELPPDRAAAAKRRLEERKKLKAAGHV